MPWREAVETLNLHKVHFHTLALALSYSVVCLCIKTGGGGVHEPSLCGEDPYGEMSSEMGTVSVHPGKPSGRGEPPRPELTLNHPSVY